MVWIVLGGLAIAAAMLVILPLYRRSAEVTDRSAFDRQIYMDQLAEIESEREHGLIGEEQAEAARTEIARRLLALDEPGQEANRGAAGNAGLLGYYLAVAIPVAVFGVYLMIGSPHLPGQPAAEVRANMPGGEDADPSVLVARLAEKLRTRPDDMTGWTLYAAALQKLGRHDEAVAAWRQVVAIDPNRAASHAQLAEALVFAADGSVTAEARTVLIRALSIDATEPRARYYAGLAASQAGDTERALVTWMGLLADSKPGAPWADLLKKRIDDLARETGIDDDRLAAMRQQATQAASPDTPRGPTEEQVRDAAAMTEAERSEMIEGMVARLAERMKNEPENGDGWVRLARAYDVLGRKKQAQEAWAKAAALKPDKVEVLSAYANAIALAAGDQSAPPPALITVSEQILVLDPDHGGALWFSGLGRLMAGDTKGAKKKWNRLLSLLDPNSPQHRELSERIKSLDTPAREK